MKRLYIVLCMVSLWLAMQAANNITVSNAEGHPGDVVTVAVGLTNDDAVTALELTIPIDEGLTYVDNSCELNAARSVDHQLTAAMVEGALRIYIYSLSLTPLAGSEGELLSFDLCIGREPGSYSLQPVAVLSDASGQSVTSSTTTGTATVLSPKMEMVTTTIDYGRVPIRSSYNGTLRIKNSGNEVLTVSDIIASSPTLVVEETTLSIAAGETKSVAVTYSPVVRGDFEASLIIASDAVNGSQTARVVAAPFSVNELHASAVEGVADNTVTVTLRMNNMEPIVAAQCCIALPEELEYVDGSAQVTARGTSHTATGSLDGTGKLLLAAYSINNTPFTGEDGDLLTFDLRLNGKSGTYALKLSDVILSNITSENMTSATTNGSVRIKSPKLNSSDSHSFGEVDITGTGTTSYTMRNTGQAPLTIERAIFLAEGYSVKTPLPLTIGVGSSAALELQYNPTAEGDFSTTMQLYSNDPDLRMKSVSVSGTVYEPNELTMYGEVDNIGQYHLTIAMENYSQITAVQLDLHGLCGEIEEDRLVKSDRMASHSVIVSPQGEGAYRIIIYAMNNAPITGNSGALLTFPIVSTSDLNPTIIADNIVLSTVRSTNKCSTNRVEWEAHYNKALQLNDQTAFVGQEIVLPIMMTNDEEVTAIQFDLHLPTGVEVKTNEKGKYLLELTDRADDHSINSKMQDDGSLRVIIISMSSAAFYGNEGAVINIPLNITDAAVDGDHEVKITGISMVTPDEIEIKQTQATATLTIDHYTPGDANGDGEVTLVDVVKTINYILGSGATDFVFTAADMNADDEVGLLDVVKIINMVLDGGASATQTMVAPMRAQAQEENTGYSLDIAYFSLGAGETKTVSVEMNNVGDITAVMFDIKFPEGVTIATKSNGKPQISLTDRADDHSINSKMQDDGSLRVMIISMSSAPFYDNSGAIIEIDVTADKDFPPVKHTVEVSGISLVSPDEVEYKPADFSYDFYTIATGLESTIGENIIVTACHREIIIHGAAEGTPVEVYNLSGTLLYSGTDHRIAIANQGIYLVRIAGNTHKIVL